MQELRIVLSAFPLRDFLAASQVLIANNGIEYRLNRRAQRDDLFRRILNRCLLYTEPATYALLTAA